MSQSQRGISAPSSHRGHVFRGYTSWGLFWHLFPRASRVSSRKESPSMDVGLREGDQAGNSGKSPDNFCRNSLSLKNPHFLGIIFKKAWQYREYSRALSIRFKMRADISKFAFLGRNLICKREQMSQALTCGRAEILTSQANFGNNHSQPQKWRGGFLCPPPTTYHGS